MGQNSFSNVVFWLCVLPLPVLLLVVMHSQHSLSVFCCAGKYVALCSRIRNWVDWRSKCLHTALAISVFFQSSLLHWHCSYKSKRSFPASCSVGKWQFERSRTVLVTSNQSYFLVYGQNSEKFAFLYWANIQTDCARAPGRAVWLRFPLRLPMAVKLRVRTGCFQRRCLEHIAREYEEQTIIMLLVLCPKLLVPVPEAVYTAV